MLKKVLSLFSPEDLSGCTLRFPPVQKVNLLLMYPLLSSGPVLIVMWASGPTETLVPLFLQIWGGRSSRQCMPCLCSDTSYPYSPSVPGSSLSVPLSICLPTQTPSQSRSFPSHPLQMDPQDLTLVEGAKFWLLTALTARSPRISAGVISWSRAAPATAPRSWAAM